MGIASTLISALIFFAGMLNYYPHVWKAFDSTQQVVIVVVQDPPDPRLSRNPDMICRLRALVLFAGMLSYYPHVRKAFDSILKLLDQQVGKPLLMTKAENINREPSEILT